MAAPVIELHDVGKRYVLGQRLAGYTTLREVLTARLPFTDGPPPPRDVIWALRDLSFAVGEGEALGVVGHNGAGKSTLLKLLARITHPTTGVSRTRGRVGSLLDVGTGFHPELTGRENIFLNGSILGMRRREIRARFDEIVDFAGLERFLETPLKRYSWGMWLRLAFAVAAHVEPDIMLVDEVLAVGDVRFREKCLTKMTELGRRGRTVVFVSHDLGSLVQLCPNALWLERGTVRGHGPSAEIVARYLGEAASTSAVVRFDADPDRRLSLLAVSVSDPEQTEGEQVQRDRPFAVAARFLVNERVPGLDVAFQLTNGRGVQVIEEQFLDTGKPLEPDLLPSEVEVRLVVPPVLPAGDYTVGVRIGSSYETVVEEPRALTFRLWPRPDDGSGAVERSRAVQPEVDWEIEVERAATRVEVGRDER